MSLKTVEWKNNSVVMIDQTKLPNILEYVTYTDFNQVADAIRTLVVRGAPAIGVSGAFGLALASLQSTATQKDELISYLENMSWNENQMWEMLKDIKDRDVFRNTCLIEVLPEWKSYYENISS